MGPRVSKHADRGCWPVARVKGWQFVPFDEAFHNRTDNLRKVPAGEYLASGRLAVVDQGQLEVGGFTDKLDVAYEGELPVIIFGDHTRVIKFIDFPFAQGADGVKVLKATDLLYSKFAYWSLKALKLPDRGYSRHYKFLRSSEFPIPPLNEQRRIVARIEELTARSKSAREALQAIPPLLEKFRQSVLAAAFRGDLTAEWRRQNPDVEPAEVLLERIRVERRRRWEESGARGKYVETEPVDATGLPELPRGWCWATLAALVVDGPTNGYSPATSPGATGTKALKLSATTSGRLVLNETTVKRIQEVIPAESRLWLKGGDVLVQRSNSLEYVGTAALYDGPDGEYIYPDLMMRLRFTQEALARWAGQMINAPTSRDFLTARATGTAGNMPKINGSVLTSLKLPTPPYEEALAANMIIEESLSRMRSVRECLTTLISDIDFQDQAILAKAFRGELVPQDPDDEPASVLLQRLTAQKPVPGQKRKRK